MESVPAACELPELVSQHYALLYRYAFRLSGQAAEAEDLTQQTFLTAQTRLSQLRDPERARNWLCTILRNLYLKDRRRNSLAPRLPLSDAPELPARGPTESTFDSERLQAALLELPEEYRSAIILFYFEEFSYQEISEQLEVPIGTVMSRLARAKAALKRRLAGEFEARSDSLQSSEVS